METIHDELVAYESTQDYFTAAELARIDFAMISPRSETIEKIIRSLLYLPLVFEKTVEQRLRAWLGAVNREPNRGSILNSKILLAYDYNTPLEAFLMAKAVDLATSHIPNIRRHFCQVKDFIHLSDNNITLMEYLGNGDTLNDTLRYLSRGTLFSIILQLVATIQILYEKIPNYSHGTITANSIIIVPAPFEWIKYSDNLYIYANGVHAIFANNEGASGVIDLDGREYEIPASTYSNPVIDLDGREYEIPEAHASTYSNPIIALSKLFRSQPRVRALFADADQYSALGLILMQEPEAKAYYRDIPNWEIDFKLYNPDSKGAVPSFIAGSSETGGQDFWRLAYAGRKLSNIQSSGYYIQQLNEESVKQYNRLADSCKVFNRVKTEDNYIKTLVAFYDSKNLLNFIENVGGNLSSIESWKSLINKNWTKMKRYLEQFPEAEELYEKVARV